MLYSNTFTGNYIAGEPGSGGGAYSAGTTVILSGNTFNGNSANGCGGAFSTGATVALTNNTFTGNSATDGAGGGAECSAYLALTIFGNTFTRNTAFGMGGGVYAAGLAINIADNLVVNNNSLSNGGGIGMNTSSNLFLINNTITANTSAGTGGGVAFQVNGLVELLNVFNNIIFGNTASGNGADVWLAGTGQQKLFEFNDVDDVNSMYGIWDLTANNIYLSPQFFDPVNRDYHTQSTSPCIAAGSINAPSLPATDLDGSPRIVNGLLDMGCYEFTTTVPHPADINGDFSITGTEFNAYAAAWKAGLPWASGPTPISANYLTRAGYLMTNNVGAYHNDGSARPVNWKTGQ
jgi:hypothetical protein